MGGSAAWADQPACKESLAGLAPLRQPTAAAPLPACSPACAAPQVCEQAAANNPSKRREVDDSSKKLGALFWRMNKGALAGGERFGSLPAAPVWSALCAGARSACVQGQRAPHAFCLAHLTPPRALRVRAPPAAGEVSQSVGGKLLQLCQALDGGDYVTATHMQVGCVRTACLRLHLPAPACALSRRLQPAPLPCTARPACPALPSAPGDAASQRHHSCPRPPPQVSLTTSDWDECSAWLTALKRLIKARQMCG